jgi:hypothetical protein
MVLSRRVEDGVESVEFRYYTVADPVLPAV